MKDIDNYRITRSTNMARIIGSYSAHIDDAIWSLENLIENHTFKPGIKESLERIASRLKTAKSSADDSWKNLDVEGYSAIKNIETIIKED